MVRPGRDSAEVTRSRPGRDSYIHMCEGFLAHLPKEVRDSAEVTRSRNEYRLSVIRQGPVGTHYSYGEGFLAHLPSKGEAR